MNRLKFEGKGFDFFKILLVDVILAFVSLTLLYPRAMIREARYMWAETSLGGSVFEFRGRTKEAFRGFMNVLSFLIIYLVLLVAIMFVLQKAYNVVPIFVDYIYMGMIVLFSFTINPLIIHGYLHFYTKNTAWRSVTASYKGKLSELMGISLRGNILTMLTLGLYSAWYETKLSKYLMENLRFGSLRFGYSGTPKELFRMYLKGFLLSVVTLGIYYIWLFKDTYNYRINHIVVRKGEQEFNLHSDANSREVFELLVGNVLLVVLTLGFGASWAIIRTGRFVVKHCVIPAEFNLDSIEDLEEEEEQVVSSVHWLDKWNPTLIG